MTKRDESTSISTPDERAVIDLFVALGLRAEPIPRDDKKKTADLRVSNDTCVLLVEVKSKLPPVEWERSLRNGEIAELDLALGKQNTISARMGEAEQQLLAMGDEEQPLRLVAWVVDPRHAVAQARQIEATLLGSRDAMVVSGDSVRRVPCVGIDHPDFERLVAVDAVIVLLPRTAGLIANPFRLAPGRLVGTRLFQTLDQCGAVLEVARAEKAGDLFVADEGWRGRPEPELRAALAAKYAVDVMAVATMVDHSAASLIDY